MKGRALELWKNFDARLTGAQRPFITSRFILMAKAVPEDLTADLDDPALEERIEQAIERLLPSLKPTKEKP